MSNKIRIEEFKLENTPDFKKILNVLSESLVNKTLNENVDITNQLKEILNNSNISKFIQNVQLANYEFTEIIEQLLSIQESDNSWILPHIISGLYEHFLETKMEKNEGLGCSADKATFIVNKTMSALITNSNLSLFQDYTNIEQIKEDKKRQAYWSPKSIKDTDEAIQLFYDWYYQN